MNCGGIRTIYRKLVHEHIVPARVGGTSSAIRPFVIHPGVLDMIRNKARMAVETAAVAGALLFAPMISHAQSADSTNASTTNYGNTNTGRHFNWGWLGLLGLLGLLPRGKKEVVTTETRNTTTGNRY